MSGNEWDTPSGRLTDYEGTVIDAGFEVNNQGRLNLNLKFATDNPDIPEWTERYGCGDEWKSLDGGETAEHPSKNNFVANSGYGKFINAVKALIPADELASTLGGSPRTAAIWVGTKWYMEEKDESFTNNATKERVEYYKNYPVKFLGRDTEVSGTPASTPAAPTGNSSNPLAALTPENLAKATEAAKTMDHGTWADQMLVILSDQGLQSDPNFASIVSAVAGEELYNSLKG